MEPSSSDNDRTMLLAFHGRNVRSFRDDVELSFESTTMSEPDVPREIPAREDGTSSVRVLPVAALFGANASGKTNLIRAMDDMRRLVLTSFRPGRTERGARHIMRPPFKLDRAFQDLPSRYEIDVVISGVRHNYGFEVTSSRVVEEWALRYPKGKAATIFRRNSDGIQFGAGTAAKSRALKDLLRDDVLLLSVAAAADYPPLRPLAEWFMTNLIFCAATSRESRWVYTAQMLEDPGYRTSVLELVRVADLGITDVHAQKPAPEVIERIAKVVASLNEAADDSNQFTFSEDGFVTFSMVHRGSGDDVVKFDQDEESLGTLVWFGVIGPVVSALTAGTVLLIDELESSLHPSLVAQLVRVFQSPESNPHGAQLVFNSHEARLLGNSNEDRIIGRDQAWFVEKNSDGASRLYPLTDFSPRRQEAIARRYTDGRYGAVPIVSTREFQEVARDIATGGDR